MARKSARVLRRRALLLEQSKEHPLYLFSLTGDEILAIADISRVSRDEGGKLIGYQRPEVKRHVEDIVSYLDAGGVVFPNAIILAISSDVRFTRTRGPQVDDASVATGTLEIPVPRSGDPKPAWIVDGQQRTLALTKAKRHDFRVPVNAFVADDIASQRDQFLRINNTKPLPRGLITELLPEVAGVLPSRLAARQLPSKLTEQLSVQPTSPFFGMIRRASMTKEQGKKAVIADSSVVGMISDSLSTPSGCLFPYRNIATGETDADSIWLIITTFWRAVQNVFPEAWGKDPVRSRLTHGVGIRSMGRLMDRVMPGIHLRGPKAVARVEDELRMVEPVCHWTSGRWEGLGDMQWNELQNVPRHIRILSNLLLRTYVQARMQAE